MSLLNPARKRSIESAGSLISRADWRFLLPDPDPQKTLCLADGVTAESVQLFSGTTSYSRFDPGNSDFDLAVLKNPDDDELRYVVSVLRPGAACYAEWDAGISFTPEQLTEKLRDAGFDTVDQYMPKPDPYTAPPGVWIPLESQGAAYYLLNSYYKSRTALRRAGKMLFRGLWSIAPWLFVRYPWLISSGHRRFKVCTIARKPGHGETALEATKYRSGLTEIEKLIQDKNGGSLSSKLRTMIISGGMNRLNKIILLVFGGDTLVPLYIVKIPRTADSESALENEANTLRALLHNYNMTNGIPRVLYDDNRLGFFSVGETYFDGRYLGDVLDRKKLPGLAGELTDWLIDLAGKTSAPLPEDWRSSHIRPLVETLERNVTGSNTALVNKAVDTIKSLEIPAFVCEHRDFAPWNILVTRNRQFRVLDWESSRLNGIPGLDLVYFLTYLCFYIEDAWTNEKALECYKKMLDTGTDLGKLYRDCFALYANKLGLAPQSYKPLRIITWITHLTSVHNRILDENAFSGSLDYNTRSLFLKLIEYEVAS